MRIKLIKYNYKVHFPSERSETELRNFNNELKDFPPVEM